MALEMLRGEVLTQEVVVDDDECESSWMTSMRKRRSSRNPELDAD